MRAWAYGGQYLIGLDQVCIYEGSIRSPRAQINTTLLCFLVLGSFCLLLHLFIFGRLGGGGGVVGSTVQADLIFSILIRVGRFRWDFNPALEDILLQLLKMSYLFWMWRHKLCGIRYRSVVYLYIYIKPFKIRSGMFTCWHVFWNYLTDLVIM